MPFEASDLHRHRHDAPARADRGGGRRLASWAARASRDRLPVWPDGCRDLVVYVEPGCRPVAVLTGVETTPRTVRLPEGTRFAGIRLPVGAKLVWEAHCPPSGSGDLYLHHLHGPPLGWLRALARHPDRIGELLQEAAADWVLPAEPLVGDFVEALVETPGHLPRLGTSERTFRRRVRALTGASPAFWVQLHRARRAGRRLVATPDPISEVAFDCGYADQAHLTRDMRRWFGATPGRLRGEAASWRALLLAPDAFAPPELPGGTGSVRAS